jgi:hypothetical protein
MGAACIISISTDPNSHFIFFDDMPADLFHGKSLHLRRISDGQWLTSEGWSSFAKAVPFEIIKRDARSSMIKLEREAISGIRFGDGIELHFDNVAPIRLRWNKAVDLDASVNFKRSTDPISHNANSVDVSTAAQSGQADCNSAVEADPLGAADGMASGYDPWNENESAAEENDLPCKGPVPASDEIKLDDCPSSAVVTAENYERRLRAIELLAQKLEAGQITNSEFQERKREIRSNFF